MSILDSSKTADTAAAAAHIAHAETKASQIDDIPADTQILPIKKVGILGAGTMGGGISMNFLLQNIPVTLVEQAEAPLERGVGIIRKNYENSVKRGKFTQEQIEQAMACLTPTTDFNALADCDLVIEAVFENMDLKKEIFAKLDKTVKPTAILATNTSALNVDEIAAATTRPENVIGLHFFSPANIMKLLEIVRGAKTAYEVLATSMDLAIKINKKAVVSGVCPGFIGNRILFPRQMQAQALILEGAKPWDVDRCLLEFGFPMGPFQMSDLAGLDLGWNKEQSNGATIRDVLCERDRRGQKTGKGYYDYDDQRHGHPSREVEEIINAFIEKSGNTPRAIDTQEILARLLFPMVNEAAKILEERMAQRASDIDVVWLNGYGWPKHTGGIMYWAQNYGLDKIIAGLETYMPQLGADFTISAYLREKAKTGSWD